MTKTQSHRSGVKKKGRCGSRRSYGSEVEQLVLLERAIRRCHERSLLSLPLLHDEMSLPQKPFRVCPLSQRRKTRRSSINHLDSALALSLSTRRRRKQPRRNAFVIRGHVNFPVSLFSVPATPNVHFEYDETSCSTNETSGYRSDSTDETSNASPTVVGRDKLPEEITQQILDESLRTLKEELCELRL